MIKLNHFSRSYRHGKSTLYRVLKYLRIAEILLFYICNHRIAFILDKMLLIQTISNTLLLPAAYRVVMRKVSYFFKYASISSFVGITQSAPFLVVIKDAAALA